ncbi:hypothetical protein FACS1894109_07200 [Spirochaetia bacterium]|nr:hypothetical protein FACS1894109_07200 [Spirochaetia bacterium]
MYAISIPTSVTTIDGRAFSAQKFTSVNIPSSVNYIGRDAFSDNDDLTRIAIGANVELDYSFDFSFDSIYNGNGRKAGIYNYDKKNRRWSYNGVEIRK